MSASGQETPTCASAVSFISRTSVARSLAPIEIREAPIPAGMAVDAELEEDATNDEPFDFKPVAEICSVSIKIRRYPVAYVRRSDYTILLKASSITPDTAIVRGFIGLFRTFRSFNIRFNDGTRLCENSA
jgi:hypothetical protein